MYTILTDDSIDRNAFVTGLNDREIGASVHFYPPVHQQPRYEDADVRATDLSNTDYVSSNIVTLPMYPSLDQGQLDRIATTVEEVAAEV